MILSWFVFWEVFIFYIMNESEEFSCWGFFFFKSFVNKIKECLFDVIIDILNWNC